MRRIRLAGYNAGRIANMKIATNTRDHSFAWVVARQLDDECLALSDESRRSLAWRCQTDPRVRASTDFDQLPGNATASVICDESLALL